MWKKDHILTDWNGWNGTQKLDEAKHVKGRESGRDKTETRTDAEPNTETLPTIGTVRG